MLGLAVTTHLYPRLEAEAFGEGRLTKIRAQAVSGRACRDVAERLGVPDRIRAAAPEGLEESAELLVGTERVLASVIESVIGACYLHHGFDLVCPAIVEAFEPEITNALENPGDFKSDLQERLARNAESVEYVVTDEAGPPHDRVFQISAMVNEEEIGTGTGKTKKEAEQEAARTALDALNKAKAARG